MFRSVTNEVRYAKVLRSSVRKNGPRAAPLLDARYGFVATEERPSFFLELFGGIEGDLDTGIAACETTESGYLGELRRLTALRDQRADDLESLYRPLLVLRSTVEVALGRGKGEQLVGLDSGITGVDPEVLRRYAWVTLGVLEDPGFVRPAGVGVPWLEWQRAATEIRPAAEAFSTTLEAVADQRREVEEGQRLREEAVDELHATTVATAKNLDAYYDLAGVKFHSERVRFGARVPSRSSESEPESAPLPDDAETGSADDGSAGPDDVSSPDLDGPDRTDSADGDVPPTDPPAAEPPAPATSTGGSHS